MPITNPILHRFFPKEEKGKKGGGGAQGLKGNHFEKKGTKGRENSPVNASKPAFRANCSGLKKEPTNEDIGKQ